jgi:4a-hydroxytetrahydrobiopterin dehydratase
MTSIKNKTCIPCESGTKPITGGDILTYLPQLQSDWNVIAGKKIQREFSFKDFTDAMEFVISLNQKDTIPISQFIITK